MGGLVVKDNGVIEGSYRVEVGEEGLMVLGIVEGREEERLMEGGRLVGIDGSRYMNEFEVEKDRG